MCLSDSRRESANSQQRPNNLLLWHGSKISNLLGILLTGLRIAPPEAPSTGFMFGKGVYFADVLAKSMNYATARAHHGFNRRGYKQKLNPDEDIDNFRVVLVCEVAVGESHCVRHAESFSTPPEGKDSVQGCGRQAPAPSGMFITNKGVGVPLGPLENDNTASYSLNYNEFIVYDESRVKIKYAVLFKDA
eukprot:TRINITY_DN6050_c0_g1_i1.p1 TRINITY_DN6050_c0_g1~~TRINITY_DN6050_c0_g1_i1.p1  ORF type:complete len:190 (-),score=50.58 TRINITY_DN6050_c0_g1_i1:95-664(-)